ncbi:MAG: F0F1 ATP synthase subunit A [Candidatus Omnitrophica bacterium]|nr:F0F1 ATP synthase subunit A [Candidatus Omnitrophota bacterium]
MNISPDWIVYWQEGVLKLNATLVYTWLVMGLLLAVSWMATRNVSSDVQISAWQNFLESMVSFMRKEIRNVVRQDERPYLPFIGALFLFIAVSNFLTVVPGYRPPTGSLSTTSALAICVFFAVPAFSIRSRGVAGYLRHYIEPTAFMLPFNILSEVSRSVALAVRLFGNIMSGTLIIAVLLIITPLFVPIIMRLFGLLIGQIQAYIFTVLSTVYIASAVRTFTKQQEKKTERSKHKEE